MKKILCLFSLLIIFILTGCRQEPPQKNEVVIQVMADADMLNPVLYKMELSSHLFVLIFQSLITPDFKSLEIVPVLAVKRPELETVNGRLHITYEIRPEAKWDNGQAITAKDAEFSLKVIKNPRVDAQRVRVQFNFIDSMIFYPANPRKFTLVCREPNIRAEILSGNFSFLPQYIYDPQGLMNEFTIHELNNASGEVLNNPRLAAFAEEFSSPKFQREKGYVAGSGAYELEQWETGRRIVLKKKQSWWGEQLKNTNAFFDAYPEKLSYEIISDPVTALTALKAGKIDIMPGIPPKDFVKDLSVSESFREKFYLFSPLRFACNFFGMNMRHPVLSDKSVRKALSHLVDADKMIETIYYGFAQRINSPVHPSCKEYNDTLKPLEYHPGKAKELLAASGWKDSNGDGTLDKVVNGKRTELEITLLYGNGNPQREGIALIFQEEARKAGIKINLQVQESSILADNVKKHRFEMYCGGIGSLPLPFDYKQQWHTASANGGFNFFYFGNEQTDALVDSIRGEMDEGKRIFISRKLQEMIYEEAPAIFLFAEKDRLAISKRFSHAEAYSLKPGYWEAGLQIPVKK